MNALAFVDVESSGLRPELGHRPWEVAAIVRDADGESEHLWQITPDLHTADPEALAVGRYQQRRIPAGWDAALFEEGRPQRATAWAVADDIRQVLHGVTLVAANIAFDAGMLTALLADHGLTASWHYRLMCVESMVAGALKLPRPPGLREAADLMSVTYNPDELHAAMPDARLVRDVYDAVMAR